ncbi:unnamed protein product [Blumeria hordei]|uniref:Uncharacterized protein n=1 Tax=Blumeria hordei TaxID=2867405 RepID=A0A383UXN5_BLUHO|nr:unnamed protein product [Blumeria hordei]
MKQIVPTADSLQCLVSPDTNGLIIQVYADDYAYCHGIGSLDAAIRIIMLV